MDININKYFEHELCPSDFSASVAELGNNAGQLTWAYAKEESEDTVLLTTFEQFAAFIEHIESMGFDFSEDEKPMNGQELNALLIQLISGDIFKGTDNNIYYYLGC